MRIDDPIEIDALDLSTLPRGRVTCAWMPILENATGEPVRLPLMIARGAIDGPVVGLTAAVHGDELNGIQAIHQLLRALPARATAGTIVAVVVSNPVAFHRRSRRIEDRWDLNHLFPGKKSGATAEILAQRLRRRVLHSFDVLIDLHTASNGRVNPIYVRADMSDPRTARMAYLQRPSIIVHNPPSDGTLRGAAASHGIPAITVEIGDPQRFQRGLGARTVAGLRAVLADLGVVPGRRPRMGAEPVLCASSAWTYTEQGGLLTVEVDLVEHVRKGQRVARLVDIFGREKAIYTAPHDGVIVGHAVDPVAPTGSRILHLGRIATSDDPILGRGDVLPRGRD